ncbi:MAG: 16S rRNA (guanine(527)-N(7))-methyltransferase RsmG [Chloroflexi bacterium]|nr:16S rRNA (guanine(527)-N(7))-methyltransferase RsmG [Chloroflexota bacterium]
MDLLLQACAQLGLSLPPEALARFAQYTAVLLEWNQQVNLTAITRPEDILLKHYVDSLTGLLPFPPPPAAGADLTVVDVGAGAGFPGVPMKLARPSIRLTLVDSVGKKTAFLRHLVDVLGLEGVAVVTGRAEELAHQPQYREGFDVAVSRAVAPLPTLLELLLPLVRVGGCAIAWKRSAIAEELWAAERALGLLGGRLRQKRALRLPGEEADRLLLVFDKVRPSPPAYPRRPGVPAKRPL